jgi:hypothetical protein
MPLFKYSASLDVGYYYQRLSKPQAYMTYRLATLKGVDYSNYTGDWEYGVQFVLVPMKPLMKALP